ncbi:unnamed protein product [Larinioides sclopetarius]|uniref:Uncharacterized protein n=1 Tax=Larinioides sclopetarius TaxID=280406 RepID=A0AAV1Z181_9ARAC
MAWVSGEARQPEVEEENEVQIQIFEGEFPLHIIPPPEAEAEAAADEGVPGVAIQPEGVIEPQHPVNPPEEIVQMQQADVPPEERPLPNGRPYRFGDENVQNDPNADEERRRRRRNAFVVFGLGTTLMIGMVIFLYRIRILLRRNPHNGH